MAVVFHFHKSVFSDAQTLRLNGDVRLTMITVPRDDPSSAGPHAAVRGAIDVKPCRSSVTDRPTMESLSIRYSDSVADPDRKIL